MYCWIRACKSISEENLIYQRKKFFVTHINTLYFHYNPGYVLQKIVSEAIDQKKSNSHRWKEMKGLQGAFQQEQQVIESSLLENSMDIVMLNISREQMSVRKGV